MVISRPGDGRDGGSGGASGGSRKGIGNREAELPGVVTGQAGDSSSHARVWVRGE